MPGPHFKTKSVQKGLELTDQGNYAFLFDGLFIRGEMEDVNKYVFSEETLQSAPLAIVIQKEFPYNDVFNKM